MKLSAFKNMLKEVFREVLREELTLGNKPLNENSNYINSFKPPLKPTNITSTTHNPIENILKETANNMSPNDYNQVSGFKSALTPNFNFTTENLTPPPAPISPGFDPDVNSATMSEIDVNMPDFNSFRNS